VAAYIRTVRTASGATAVQIVHGSRRGARDIEHVGSAHDEQELEALKAAAGQRLSAGQGELDLGLDAAGGEPVGSAPLQIVSSRMGHLWDGLCAAYDALGFDQAVEGDEVFRQLVLARVIEPTSKQDSLRVLAETGIETASYATRQAPPAGLCHRRVPAQARRGLRAARRAGSGVPGAL
jgi:hypothetical protein